MRKPLLIVLILCISNSNAYSKDKSNAAEIKFIKIFIELCYTNIGNIDAIRTIAHDNKWQHYIQNHKFPYRKKTTIDNQWGFSDKNLSYSLYYSHDTLDSKIDGCAITILPLSAKTGRPTILHIKKNILIDNLISMFPDPFRDDLDKHYISHRTKQETTIRKDLYNKENGALFILNRNNNDLNVMLSGPYKNRNGHTTLSISYTGWYDP